MVRDILRCIDHGSEEFRLITLDDGYIVFGGTAPQFNSIFPNRFEYRFVDQYLFSSVRREVPSMSQLNSRVLCWICFLFVVM
jgi:hypothetical protein